MKAKAFELRDKTGFNLWECKRALALSGGDVALATARLKRNDGLSPDITAVKTLNELEIEITNAEFDDSDREDSLTIYECLSCHWRFVGEANRSGYEYTTEGVQTPNYCPMCGKKIDDVLD